MKKNWNEIMVYVVKLAFNKNNVYHKNNEVRTVERYLVLDSRLSIEDVKQQIETSTKDKFDILSLSKVTSGLHKN